MTWTSAFYIGGDGQVVRVPIEAVSFEVVDKAEFGSNVATPVFVHVEAEAAFDFSGEPVFQPINQDGQFNVEC